jgi:hypothetical protein
MPQTIANVSIRVLPFAELDAYVQASAQSFPLALAFVVADLSGVTFSGQVEVQRDGETRLIVRVIDCRRSRTPDLHGLVELVRLARSRIALSLARERLVATSDRAAALSRRLREAALSTPRKPLLSKNLNSRSRSS